MILQLGYNLVYTTNFNLYNFFPSLKRYLDIMYGVNTKMSIVDRPNKKRTIDEIIEFCKKYKKNDFCLDNDDFILDFGINQSDNYICYSSFTKIEREENLSEGLRILVGQNSFKELLSASVYSKKYQFTQNTTNPEDLDYYGIDHTNLVKKDLGYRVMIDISTHPGRGYSRYGYIEEVCSEMYITRELCKRTGADYEQIKTTDWLKTDEVCEGVLHLVAWSEPFTSAEGEQAEVQNRLRKLLFPLSYDKKENWRL